MSDRNEARVRRARASRAKIAELRAVRLTVHRSNGHIYAQVIDASGSKVLAAASTAEKEVRGAVKYGGKGVRYRGENIVRKAGKAGKK